jgi:hypothetical protein
VSAKSTAYECFVLDENSDGDAHLLSVTADFISTDCVYVGIKGQSYAVDVEEAREMAKFILAQTPGEDCSCTTP